MTRSIAAATGDPAEPRRRIHIAGLAALVCLFAFEYGLYGLFHHWHFGSSYDLGIFDQAVWHLSRLEAPASSISGFSNILGDHFYPILALFAPLYWIAPAPETLIVAQAVLFAVSLVPVYLFLRNRLSQAHSFALSSACGLFWGLQRAAAFDVHEIAFAPLVIATAVLAMDRQRWVLFWIAALVLILVKEDLIPLLMFLGLWLMFRGERRRGGASIIAGLLAFFVVIQIVIPSFSDRGHYNYGATFRDIVHRPWMVPVTLLTPVVKLRTIFLWLAPFAFLPVFSPLSLLCLPIVLSRLLSDTPTHWGTAFHYAAPLAPILAMSAGDGLVRVARRISQPQTRMRLMNSLTVACVVLSLFLPGNEPVWKLFQRQTYRATPLHETGYRALQHVPDDASVVAQAAVVPHLSERERAYLLDSNAPEADFVVAATGLSPWPNATSADIRRLVEERQARGYIVVFDENGWTVLRRR